MLMRGAASERAVDSGNDGTIAGIAQILLTAGRTGKRKVRHDLVFAVKLGLVAERAAWRRSCVRRLARAGRANGAPGEPLRSKTGMKRIRDAVWPTIGLGAVAVSSWLLFKELHGLSFASLKSALFSIPPARWLLAIASTSLAYAALAWYDQVALRHLNRRVNWRYVAVASFTAYALAHNIGASVFSGAVARYRAYSEKGLSVGEIGVLVAFCSFTFALGAAMVGGFCLLLHPELVERFGGAPFGSVKPSRPRSSRHPASMSSAPFCTFLRLRSDPSSLFIPVRRSRRGNCSRAPWS